MKGGFSIKNFITYLNLLIELNKKHVEMFDKKKHVSLPCLFTESLCQKLCSEKYIKSSNFRLIDKKEKTRDYDKLTIKNKQVEIKATGSNIGSTTINKDVLFDYLYWLYFDFNDIIEIKIIDKSIIKNVLKDKTNKRPGINLKNLKPIQCFKYKVLKDKITII